MNRIFVMLFATVLFGGTLPARASGDRPNIVLIMVDDMGWSNIGCYGGLIETPNLDRLADGGVRFNHFYNGARCCPTRATLMTGLHPHQVGVGHMTLPMNKKANNPDPNAPRVGHALTTSDRQHVPQSYQGWLDTAIPTLPEMLRASDYGTYMTGKWHLSNEKRETWPTQRGFDHYYGHLSGGSSFWNPDVLHRTESQHSSYPCLPSLAFKPRSPIWSKDT